MSNLFEYLGRINAIWSSVFITLLFVLNLVETGTHSRIL